MQTASDTSAFESIHVGCAGWSLPSAYASDFGEGQSALQRYATRFSRVEINSSFYRPHKPETYARWALAVPAHFRFSVKMPQTISHDFGLRGAAPLLDPFLHAVNHLGDRLGALLLQLPPRLDFDARVASAFFRAVRRRTDVALACEPRHETWFSAAAESLLERYGIARVAADPARVAQAVEPGGARHLSYWRWHGRPKMYYSSYPDGDLRALAQAAGSAAGQGPVWIILDNTAQGHAIPNALRLLTLLEENRHA